MSDTSPNILYADVLIVGAGPAGLMAAHALAQGGIKVKLIDIRPVSVPTGQADGIMPRTIEVFQSYGLAERLLKEANQVNMVAFYNAQEGDGIRKTQCVPVIDEKTARYPFLLTLNQGAIENIFIDALAEYDVIVDRPVRPISLILSPDKATMQDPDSYSVIAVLEHLQAGGTTETVHSKFVIGADGAHSWCRRALGIEMEGEQTDHVWGAIDFTTTPAANFPDWRKICTINAANTTILLIPREQDKLRLYLDLGSENGVLDAVTGRVASENIDPKKLLEIGRIGLQPFVIPPGEIDWWTCYVVGQRVATRFSIEERAFIVGDACHMHSPKAGQGMNVSMNDAHNLAWKLLYVLRGWSDLSLLKTYEFERRKFAQQLIAFDKWYETGFSVKSRSELLNDKETRATSIPESPWEAFRAFSGLTSGIGIRYDSSVLTLAPTEGCQTPARLLTIGQRLPPCIVLRAADSTPIDIQDMCPSNTHFKVIVFSGDLTEASQATLLNSFADATCQEGGILKTYRQEAFDIIVVMKGSKETAEYMQIPVVLRSRYDQVLLDDVDASGRKGGRIYETYGVDAEGAVVIVRPDGFVGATMSLKDEIKLSAYFAAFMKS